MSRQNFAGQISSLKWLIENAYQYDPREFFARCSVYPYPVVERVALESLHFPRRRSAEPLTGTRIPVKVVPNGKCKLFVCQSGSLYFAAKTLDGLIRKIAYGAPRKIEGSKLEKRGIL